MSDKIKSAYELAMERADRLQDEGNAENLERQDQIKPILSRFFQGKIDAEELWDEFEDKGDSWLLEAQRLMIDSLGLNSNLKEVELRKEGLLALENLKEKSDVSSMEKIMADVKKMVEQYNTEQEKLRERLERMIRNNTSREMRPMQTEDGRTVMQMVESMDEDTRRQVIKSRQEMEKKFQQHWESLKEQLFAQIGLEA